MIDAAIFDELRKRGTGSFGRPSLPHGLYTARLPTDGRLVQPLQRSADDTRICPGTDGGLQAYICTRNDDGRKEINECVGDNYKPPNTFVTTRVFNRSQPTVGTEQNYDIYIYIYIYLTIKYASTNENIKGGAQ